MPNANYLTDAQVRVLGEMFELHGRRRLAAGPIDSGPARPAAAGCYMARLTVSGLGVPVVLPGRTGTQAGRATCEVWRMEAEEEPVTGNHTDTESEWQVVPVLGPPPEENADPAPLTREVLNHTTQAVVEPGQTFMVQRDAYGQLLYAGGCFPVHAKSVTGAVAGTAGGGVTFDAELYYMAPAVSGKRTRTATGIVVPVRHVETQAMPVGDWLRVMPVGDEWGLVVWPCS